MRKLILAVLLCYALPALADSKLASDDFTRLNGGLGANWTAVGTGTWAISSNTAIVTGISQQGAVRYTAATFTNDQYSTFSVAGWTNAISYGAAVRIQSSNAFGYFIGCSSTGSGLCYQIRIFRRDSGNSVLLESTNLGTPIPSGTQVTLKISGTALSVWIAGSQVDAGVTDSTYSTGIPGMLATGSVTDPANGFTYWEGGNVGSSGSLQTVSASDSLGLSDSLATTKYGGGTLYTKPLADSLTLTPNVTGTKLTNNLLVRVTL